MDRLSPEVRAFLAQAGEGKGVLVEDPRTQERYCVVKFREPTPEEQRAALQRMSEIGAAVEGALNQRQMSVQDAERELQQAIAEVRREKAGV
jgi:hypothetical protein